MKKLLFTAILALAGLCLMPFTSRANDPLDIAAWQRVPVLHNGRVMPMDSYARQTLLAFSGKSTFNRQSAAYWMARVFFTPESTRNDEIFLVNNPEVIEALGLPAEGRRRYSYSALEASMVELTRLARGAFHLDAKERSPVEAEIIRLYSNLNQFSALMQGLDFVAIRPDLAITSKELRSELDLPESDDITLYDLQTRKATLNELAGKARGNIDEQSNYARELFSINMTLRMSSRHRNDSPPMIIPAAGGPEGVTWISAKDAFSSGNPAFQPLLGLLNDMAKAFRAGNAGALEAAGRAYMDAVRENSQQPENLRLIDTELMFNRTDAFYRTQVFFGLGFIATMISIAFRGKWIYRIALALIILGLIPQTYGIIARMIIMARPPTTNLYSTFVFVSWCCVLIGLAIEYFQRNRLGLLTASAMGLALMMTSARFGAEGDTMGVMVAVLDSNFWLATHVVTISIGYAGCSASALLGHVYLLQALRRSPDDASLKQTDRAVFGAQALGLIFTYLGTMLGGVWADQSWGRFWGWDPKENGALVIVLWSAILFHARLARMIGPRGFAAGSIIGFIAVLAAWIGVNLLGVGLHSYGFTSGLARGFVITTAVELLFILLTLPFSKKAINPPAS